MDAPPALDEDLELLMNNVPGWEKKIPDIAKYRASIRIPETVKGDVGGVEQPEPRYVQRDSPQGQAIVAARLKRDREASVRAMETEPVTEAAAPVQAEAAPVVVAAPAPAATVEVTEPLHRLPHVARCLELAQLERNFWIALVETNLTRWQDMAADWDGSKACPPFDIVSPRSSKPQRGAPAFYQGAIPDGVDPVRGLRLKHCTTDKMKADWAVAGAFSLLARNLYKAEHDAYERMLQLSKKNNFNGGTRGRGERVRYGDADAYVALIREVTERQILDDKKTFDTNSLNSLRKKIARCDDILDALAAPFEDLDKSALVKVDKQGRRQFHSPVVPSDLPCFKGQPRKTNLDHVDGGWADTVRAVRKSLIRRLCDEALNKRFPGIEFYLDPRNAAVRAYLDAYIPSAMCHDALLGELFKLEFEVEDPIKWHRLSRTDQGTLERSHIRRVLLKGAMLALTDDDVELEGLDAVRLTLLRGRYPGLTFKRAASFVRHSTGRFSAQFMDRGVVEMVIEHIGLATYQRKGKWYRRVGFRGLLPEDENRYASGYEWMKELGLEEYCRDYLAKPLYKTGYKTDHGEVVAAAFAKEYGPDPFRWNL